MKNEDLCDLIFRKNFTFGRRTSKFAKENPQIAPPQEKKKKKSNRSQNSNSTYKIKTCQGRNRMIGWNIPQNFFEF